MTFDAQTSLADVVTVRPELAPVLDRMGLDFCCGGSLAVAEAAASAGLSPDEVLGILAAVEAEPPPDWTSLGPSGLVDHIEATHHRFLRERLPFLSGAAAKVVDVHGANHPELASVAAVFEELRADLEPHLLEEEQLLFPMVRELSSASGHREARRGQLEESIAGLVTEHDRAGELLARLRELTDDHEPPADACATYRALYAGLAELEADTHLHVHKENNLLFPAVLADATGR